MYYFWLTVFPALVVFIAFLPATVRRFREQRKALRPIEPIARYEHFPCIVNTIGAAFTEFALLGLMAFGVFVLANATFGTLAQAPDLNTGIRYLSLGTLGLFIAVGIIIAALLKGGGVARGFLLFSVMLAVLMMMVMSSAGDQGPAILLFALTAVGVPAVVIAILRLIFRR